MTSQGAPGRFYQDGSGIDCQEGFLSSKGRSDNEFSDPRNDRRSSADRF